jgi:hypothetical protein
MQWLAMSGSRALQSIRAPRSVATCYYGTHSISLVGNALSVRQSVINRQGERVCVCVLFTHVYPPCPHAQPDDDDDDDEPPEQDLAALKAAALSFLRPQESVAQVFGPVTRLYMEGVPRLRIPRFIIYIFMQLDACLCMRPLLRI